MPQSIMAPTAGHKRVQSTPFSRATLWRSATVILRSALGVGLSLALLSACATGRQAGGKDLANSRDPVALTNGAEQALQQKQYRVAVQMLVQAANVSDDEALAQRATETAFVHHQYSYVLESANRWLQINPTSEDAHRLGGLAALQLYKIDTSANYFDSLIASAYISPQAGFMTLASQWFQEGSQPAVLALMQRLLPKYEQLAEAHYVYAQAAMQSDNNQLALTHAQRAVELSPYWTPAQWLLARAQLVIGQSDAAIKTARAIVEQDDSVDNHLELGQFLLAAGQIEESRKELVPLTNNPQVAARAQRALALMEMEHDEQESAMQRWRDLVRSGRFTYEGMYYLGQIVEQRGAIRDAIELYSRVTDGDHVVAAQTRAAYLKAKQGKVSDGIVHLQGFVSEHDDYTVDVISAQASLLLELDDTPQALEVLDEGLATYPEQESLRVSKALLLERMKRMPQAIEVMRSLVRDRPDDPSALNMLGYTLIDNTHPTRDQIHEGYEMIQKASKALPDSGAVQDSMGWALHKLDRNDEALKYLQQAMNSVRDPDVAVHLGEVQWALGKHDEARATWQAALTDFPNNPELQEKLQKK
jgi:tetratricopeptide (TPR) repeat protein